MSESTIPRVQATAPERIHLILAQDDITDDSRRREDEDFSDAYGETLWSVDAIDCSVPYIRADLAAPSPSQQEADNALLLRALLTQERGRAHRGKCICSFFDPTNGPMIRVFVPGRFDPVDAYFGGVDASGLPILTEEIRAALKQALGDK